MESSFKVHSVTGDAPRWMFARVENGWNIRAPWWAWVLLLFLLVFGAGFALRKLTHEPRFEVVPTDAGLLV